MLRLIREFLYADRALRDVRKLLATTVDENSASTQRIVERSHKVYELREVDSDFVPRARKNGAL